ncbi:MAG TPA: extracellular solute-binding protein [Candidatus Bathyarchaeota archaeon]|nr:MAG: hypothetical protein DRO34_04475 [Candidatus Bathyarchaeota archaeon]HDI07550.1 extracellular solute-binding protein [Candidatus Bathyarchaeota archaeon]
MTKGEIIKIVVALVLGLIIGGASVYYVFPREVTKTEYTMLPEHEYLRNKFKGMTLRVTCWSGPYEENFRKAVCEPFEELTGATIELVPGWAEFISQLEAAPPDQPPWDVFNADGYNYLAAKDLGKLIPINLSNVPNAQYVYECLKAQRDEWKTKLGIPFDGGLYTIIINREMIEDMGLPEITSWKDLERPEYDGLIAMDETWYYGIYVGAFLLDEEEGAGEVYTDIDAVFNKMAEFKDHVGKWYTSGAEALQYLLNKEVAVAIYYTGGAWDAIKNQGEPLEILIPEEGTLAWLGSLCIVNGTKVKELAEAFINFALSPISQSRHVTLSGNFVTGNFSKVPDEQYFNPSNNEEMSKLVFFDWGYLLEHWTEFEERWNTEILGGA